eukprot:PhF_6_TR41347/c0_g1_i1/m.62761/K01768/E4.6.1.1; adenylate cyclase
MVIEKDSNDTSTNASEFQMENQLATSAPNPLISIVSAPQSPINDDTLDNTNMFDPSSRRARPSFSYLQAVEIQTQQYQHKRSPVIRFLTSVRFTLPAFVTIAMLLVTVITIYLMNQNTQEAVQDVVHKLQHTSLLSAESEVGGAFRQLALTTRTHAKYLSMHPVPNVVINHTVSLDTYSFVPALYQDMSSAFLCNPFVDMFFFLWPSGRMLAGSSTYVADLNDENMRVTFNQIPDTWPNTTFITYPLIYNTSEIFFTDQEKRWNSIILDDQRNYAILYAVHSKVDNHFVGIVSGATQLNVVHKYLEDALPTANARGIVYETTGHVFLETSTPDEVFRNASMPHDIWDVDSNEVIKTCGRVIWTTRPLVPGELSHPRCHAGDEEWYMGTVLIDGDGAHLYVTIIIPESDVLGSVNSGTRTTIIICSVISAVCIALVLSGTFIIGNALEGLQRKLRYVAFMGVEDEKNMSNPDLSKSSVLLFSELQETQESYLTLRNAIQAFHFYVPQNVVRGVLSGTMHSSLGMTQRFLVVSFQDIEKFTALCEQNRNNPDRVIDIVSPMFEEVSLILTQNHGTIDKYIGDCIMTYWEVDNTTTTNRTPSLACRNAVAAAQASLFVEPLHGVRFRCGIHCGSALLGNFGSAQRFNYTAVGDTVNTAARIEALNKEFHSQALCSEDVEGFLRLKNANAEGIVESTRYVGKVKLVGKDTALGMYEIRKHAFPEGVAGRQTWEELLKIKLERDHAFEAVNEALNEIIPENQDDPTLEYIRGQVVSLNYVKQNGINTYKGYWQQNSK